MTGALTGPGEILLLSCYELGRQPLGLAVPLGALREAGYQPSSLDLAVEPFDESPVRRARFVGISAPMHTALKLAIAAGRRVRIANPAARLCFYGLYAALNAELLRDEVDSIAGPDEGADLVRLVRQLAANGAPAAATP